MSENSVMWQVELRRLVRKKTPAVANLGAARRILSCAGSGPSLLPLLAVYLGSRADLIPLQECAALLESPCRSQPLSADEVAKLLRDRLGSAVGELLETLEPAPREVDLFYQVHGARTRSGDRVLVKLLRPGARDQAESDLRSLLAEIGHSPVGRDFRRFVRSRLDFASEAAALRMLAEDGRTLGIMTAPRVLGTFCRPDVLVTEDCGQNAVAWSAPESEVYSAWLRQSVMGRVFPSVPAACAGPACTGGPVISSGGSLVPLSEKARRNIARYLLALCADDPDRAADALMDQSEPGRNALSEEKVRRLFRFRAPERESPLEWLDRPGAVSQCITHWRLLSGSGWTPEPTLLAFLRGLTLLTVRNAADAERDLLLESLDEIRPHLLVYQGRRILEGIQSGSSLGGIAALVRRALTRVPLGLVAAAEAAPSLMAFGSRLLLFVAAGVLAPAIVARAGPNGELLAAAVVLVAGVSALASAVRPWIAGRGCLKSRRERGSERFPEDASE